MRLGAMLREALASLAAQRIPTLLVAVLTGAMCATVLATVGRSAHGEQVVLARIEAAGSRTLEVVEVGEGGLLTAQVVATITALSSVDRAVGLATARDVTVGWSDGSGPKIVSWELVGRLDSAIAVEAGRMPRPGEAVVSRTAAANLGLDGPVGIVRQGEHEYPVVGIFEAREPFGKLEAGVVIAATSGTTASTLSVVARSHLDVRMLTLVVVCVVAPPSSGDITIRSPETLAAVQSQVQRDLVEYGRGLVMVVLVGGGALIAVVVLSDLLIRRVDLGRRRALGITRGDLIGLVVARTGMSALIGVVCGIGIGLAVCWQLGTVPPAEFVYATGVLAMMVAGISSLPAAVAGAFADPVRVVRTA